MNLNWTSVIAYLTKSIGGGLMGVVTSLFSVVKQGFNMTMQFHQQSIATARQIGMTNAQAHAYSQVLARDAAELGVKYGITADAVKKITENLSNAIGRNVFLNQQQREAMVQMNKLVGEQTTSDFMTQMVSGMGAQVDAVNGAVAKTYATAMKQGLNVTKMSAKVAQNLQLANRLSFRDGVNGIIRMAALSEKVGANLSSISSTADKFLDLDHAIENAAKMQMLGGSAAMYGGNPLTMAYEANYDPEALMERMTKTLGGYATFDVQKGMARVNGLSMDFIRQIAANMGISAEEATTIAKRQAEARYKENAFGGEINAIANGNEDLKNFLLNTSQVSGGSLVMRSESGEMKNISYFRDTVEGQKELKSMMELQAMDEKDLMQKQATELTSINEKITGFETSLMGLLATLFEPWIPGLQNFVDDGAHSLIDAGKQLVEGIRPYMPKIRDGIVATVNAFSSIGKVITDAIVPAVRFLGDHWAALLAAIAAVRVGGMMASRSTSKVSGNIGKGAANSGKSWKQIGTYTKNAYRMSSSPVKGVYNAGKTLTKFSKLARGGVGGAVGGLVGIGVDAAADAGLLGKEGSFGYTAGKTAASAAEYAGLGAMIGSIIPGVGTAVGAGIGAVFGGVKGLLENSTKKIEETIKSGATPTASVKSNFSDGGIIEGSSYDGDRLKVNVNSGEMIINRSDQGKLFNLFKTSFGLLNNSPRTTALGVDGVKLVSAMSPMVSAVSLLAKNAILKSNGVESSVVAKPVGEKEYIYTPTSSRSGNVNGNEVTVKDFNVNINGTIRLDGGGSMKNVDVNELLKDQAFVSSLKEIIKESINHDMNGGRFNQDIVTRRGGVANKTIW